MKQLAETFWTIRGRMKIAGVIDVGTHMSLVRRGNGRFVLLDSYEPGADDLAALREITAEGRVIDAILNLHPYHTLHCAALHRLFPEARLIGTRRHARQLPKLPWESGTLEDAATRHAFAEDLDLSVPDGIDLVTSDEKVHAGSILARDRASGIVHVDDTLCMLEPPSVLGAVLPAARLRFHPSLGKALQHRAGAADAFDAWARRIAGEWNDAPAICLAHKAIHEVGEASFGDQLRAALDRVSGTLDRHRKAHG